MNLLHHNFVNIKGYLFCRWFSGDWFSIQVLRRLQDQQAGASIIVLPDLQCRNGECYAQYRYDPESCHNLTFMIAQLLVMMMQGAHEENPFSLSVFFLSVFKIRDRKSVV